MAPSSPWGPRGPWKYRNYSFRQQNLYFYFGGLFLCVLFISVHSMMISNKGNLKLPDITDSTRRVIYYKRNEYKLISEHRCWTWSHYDVSKTFLVNQIEVNIIKNLKNTLKTNTGYEAHLNTFTFGTPWMLFWFDKHFQRSAYDHCQLYL